jgi:hypothetical protein
MNSGLTFKIGPKADSNASPHTNYLITLLKSEAKKGSEPIFRFDTVSPMTVRVTEKRALTPFLHLFSLTHNYTGEPGPLNSPGLPVCLDSRGLAEAHRSLSERGIITAGTGRSTPFSPACEPLPPLLLGLPFPVLGRIDEIAVHRPVLESFGRDRLAELLLQ